MRRLPAAVLVVGLMVPAACSPAVDSALGERPTSYPVAGQSAAAAPAPQGSVDRALLAVASRAAEAALTYDHETYAADTATAQQLMTPAFAASWGDVAERLRPNTDKRAAHVHAKVVDAALSGATARRAEVLLFVDRTLQTATGTEQLGGIAVATLARRGDVWLLDGLGLEPPARQVLERRPVPATVVAAASSVADAWANLSSKHPRADVARMLSLSTGPFRREYHAAARDLVERTLAAGAVQEGRVLSVGIANLGDRRARALAAVETTLQVQGAEPTRRLVRLALVLVRTRSAWLAREIRVVPSR